MVSLLLEHGARVAALSSPPEGKKDGAGGSSGSGKGETALEVVQRALKGEAVLAGAASPVDEGQLRQGAWVGCFLVGFGSRGVGVVLEWDGWTQSRVTTWLDSTHTHAYSCIPPPQKKHTVAEALTAAQTALEAARREKEERERAAREAAEAAEQVGFQECGVATDVDAEAIG